MQEARLLDNLVGEGKQRQRDREAQSLRGPQIDDQIDLGGLYHRQVRWLITVENFAGVQTSLTVRFGQAGP
jgi:hypothetical protein